MYSCSDGHETLPVGEGLDKTFVVIDIMTRKQLARYIPADDYEQEDMRERLESGECPICQEWEYTPA